MDKIDELIVLSAVDPLNLVGILTPENRVAAIHRNRVLYRDGLPIAAVEAGQVRRPGEAHLADGKRRPPPARRPLGHPPRPHLRLPPAREGTLPHRQKG